MLKNEIVKQAEKLRMFLDANPQLDEEKIEERLYKNEKTELPLSTLLQVKYGRVSYEISPELARLREMPEENKTDEHRILQGILSCSLPLQGMNPSSLVLYTGKGPGTLASCFGMKLSSQTNNSPMGRKTADEILNNGIPNPRSSGILPEIFEFIESVKRTAPPCVKIAPPDTQGPYNLAHMLLGEEIFFLPLDDPEKFDALLTLITDFYIKFYDEIRKAIGPERYVFQPNSRTRLRLCSVNLISAETYLEFVVKHDKRIAEYFGEICIHPCSGRHVFYSAIRNIPNIIYIEAIPFARADAPSVTPEEGMAEVGDRPIRLEMARNAKKDELKEMILKDFEICKAHPTFYFNYDTEDMTGGEVQKLRNWMIEKWRS